MTGVVLCGGKSSRMGADKGLLEQQASTWAELAANKLITSGLSVALSVNEQQYPFYLEKFKQLLIIPDSYSLDVYGPLKGILSVHLYNPVADLLVIACDMPAMKTAVIDHLVTASEGEGGEAFVFKNDAHAEPLCAIYTSIGLKKIYEDFKQNQLKKHSLRHALEKLDTRYLHIPASWKHYFANYNSPEDLVNLKG